MCWQYNDWSCSCLCHEINDFYCVEIREVTSSAFRSGKVLSSTTNVLKRLTTERVRRFASSKQSTVRNIQLKVTCGKVRYTQSLNTYRGSIRVEVWHRLIYSLDLNFPIVVTCITRRVHELPKIAVLCVLVWIGYTPIRTPSYHIFCISPVLFTRHLHSSYDSVLLAEYQKEHRQYHEKGSVGWPSQNQACYFDCLLLSFCRYNSNGPITTIKMRRPRVNNGIDHMSNLLFLWKYSPVFFYSRFPIVIATHDAEVEANWDHHCTHLMTCARPPSVRYPPTKIMKAFWRHTIEQHVRINVTCNIHIGLFAVSPGYHYRDTQAWFVGVSRLVRRTFPNTSWRCLL